MISFLTVNLFHHKISIRLHFSKLLKMLLYQIIKNFMIFKPSLIIKITMNFIINLVNNKIIRKIKLYHKIYNKVKITLLSISI